MYRKAKGKSRMLPSLSKVVENLQSIYSHLNVFSLADQKVPMQTVYIQMRRPIMSRLIRIYTVCLSGFDFRLKPLFASVDMSICS